jgi:hypothetical protein
MKNEEPDDFLQQALKNIQSKIGTGQYRSPSRTPPRRVVSHQPRSSPSPAVAYQRRTPDVPPIASPEAEENQRLTRRALQSGINRRRHSRGGRQAPRAAAAAAAPEPQHHHHPEPHRPVPHPTHAPRAGSSDLYLIAVVVFFMYWILFY